MTMQEPAFLPHALTAEEVVARLGTAPDGLTERESADRLRRYGRNSLPEPRAPRALLVYLSQFKSPLVYLLLAASLVSLLAGDIVDAAFIFAVLQMNALIGTVQEWRGISRSRALHSMIQVWAEVVREGRRQHVNSSELVQGDVVQLESGMRVPADARVLEARDLLVDESLLSGESTPVTKVAGQKLAEDTAPSDRVTMVYAGTTVLAGRATAIVTHTSLHTQLGQIAGSLREVAEAPPPLVRQMQALTRGIAVVTLVLCAAVAVLEYFRGGALAEVFLLGVALAVSAIPEGLPVAITVALSVATVRMSRRNVVVRRLAAVEGLGACTLIASDKTGTLTLNELTVRVLWMPGIGEVPVSGEGYRLEGAVGGADGGPPVEAQDLARAGAWCNEAHIEPGPDDSLRHSGDTVDVAFLVLARKAGISPARPAPLSAIAYEPAQRFAATFYAEGERTRAYVKGAVETVLAMCDPRLRELASREGERLAASGYRVLAVASGLVGEAAVNALHDLRLLGIVGIIDPLRPEAAAAVSQCHSAGLSVVMITGDHPLTALAIAKQLGIAGPSARVTTGSQLGALEGGAFDAAVRDTSVFARAQPLQKQAIVQSLQRAGHTVAVTGDGVNDAPALHSADIGVAMGRGGTDVARDAGDLVLADDNFASVVAGVEEGRVAYDNIRKVVWLLLGTGAAEIALFVLALALGLPLPLHAAQLLWLNLVTNGVQDVTLALERTEPDVMQRPPRRRGDSILDARMLGQVVLCGVVGGVLSIYVFQSCLNAGWALSASSSATLLFLVLYENVQVLICRSETRSLFRVPIRSNPWVIGGVVAAQLLQLLALQVPPLALVLDVEALPVSTWLWLLGLALLVVPFSEAYKAAVRVRLRARPVTP